MNKLFTTFFTSLILLTALVSTGAAAKGDALAQALASRSAEDQARDGARHPLETLQFFSVEPGMTVAEGLPGGGWYSKVLAPYLGADGTLYGVNYADRMWPMFGFMSPEVIATRKASSALFGELVAGFTDNGVKASGFTFETVPAEVAGTVDRVLLIRALHNLNRFEAASGTRTQALAAVHSMLKDDGLVGVVQHRAAESAKDEAADGRRGYLKQSAVISMFADAGFELVAESEINANAKDQAGDTDIVWRLAPSLRGTKEDSKAREAVEAIGESDRMTLLFKKAS